MFSLSSGGTREVNMIVVILLVKFLFQYLVLYLFFLLGPNACLFFCIRSRCTFPQPAFSVYSYLSCSFHNFLLHYILYLLTCSLFMHIIAVIDCSGFRTNTKEGIACACSLSFYSQQPYLSQNHESLSYASLLFQILTIITFCPRIVSGQFSEVSMKNKFP